MPLYSFECPSCDHREVKLINIREYSPNGHYCPVCEDMELVRDIQADNIHVHTYNCGTTSVYKRHGITNPITGEGLKKHPKEH